MMALNTPGGDVQLQRRAGGDPPGVGGGCDAAWRCSTPRAAIANAIGFDITPQSAGGGSDGNFTGAMGVPTLDGLGVSGGGGHTLEEHTLVSSLVPRARLLAGLFLRPNSVESTA